jgi:antitoxin (DNA-binding transcriptional repressor) of toxin-antitoxin stability system
MARLFYLNFAGIRNVFSMPCEPIVYMIDSRKEASAMRFVSVRDLRTKSSEIWQELPRQKEMIITNNGRPIAILSSIHEDQLEDVLSVFRHARASRAVATLQYDSVKKGTDKISLDEIENVSSPEISPISLFP